MRKMIISVFLISLFFSCVSFNIVNAESMLGVEYAAHAGLGENDLRRTVAGVISGLLGFLGVGALCLIIYGGFMWTTSLGNREKVDKAKKTILYALIGLAIILASYAITSFVLRNVYQMTTGYYYW
jgi:cbb3-type cytochrome oxidase subunit 3